LIGRSLIDGCLSADEINVLRMRFKPEVASDQYSMLTAWCCKWWL